MYYIEMYDDIHVPALNSSEWFFLVVVSMPTSALAAFGPSTDPIYTSMSDADCFKYNALFLNDHSASINWHERRRTVSASNTLVASMNTNAHTTLSINTGPFILDSGATIHISLDTSDFFELKPIAPRLIKGIGGSSISTMGIGRIHLQIAKSLELTLEPVLFIPEASVHLISIFILGSGPQKLVSHFDGSGCWLTNTSGTTIASGKISAMGKHLYTLNMGSPLVKHSFIATRILDMETWRHHLGHVNYKSIVDMSNNGMVKGMHINLSSTPPKCESCILRKQTKTPVPKIREGVHATGLLDVVYIDLTSPQSVQSTSRFNYVMNIIDNASSFVHTCLLPLKSSAIKAFKEWVLLAK
jgi:hypothetical protein